MVSIYMCPVCHLSLDRLERQFACADGHTFDIAREGYVNPLLSGYKSNKLSWLQRRSDSFWE